MKNNLISRVLAVGIAAVAVMSTPMAVFAEDPTASGSGIDTADGQQYNSGSTEANKWEDSATESAASDDENGHKENTYDGQIHLFYDTTGGKWQDPGQDPTKADDNTAHDNGSYIVTIPTKIAYLNMNIGRVSTSDDYTVNVRGAIAQDKKVTLSAETGNYLVNGSKTQEIQETTTQGKTAWTAAEAYGKLNADGSLSGTNTTDNIKMAGEVTTSGTYEGHVQYTAALADAA